MTLQEKLKLNTDTLLNSFKTLTNEQIQFKPADTVWSISEIIEHIFLVDVGVAKVLTLPPEKGNTENNRTELFSDQKLNTLLVNRSFKVPAPDFVSPKGRFANADDAAKNINIIIDKIIHHLDTNKIEEETHTIKHQVLGEMTKTDWVHFLIHHTNRHLMQLEEVKKSIVIN